MRSLVLAIVVLAAACDAPPGLTLEVLTDDPMITGIEVFVGEPCDDCPSLLAPPNQEHKAAELYLTSDAMPWSATATNGVAGFRITTDHDVKVPIIIVVGVDAQRAPRATATLRDVTISAAAAEYWQTKLVTAEPIVPRDSAPAPPDGTERVALWFRPSETLPACVMVEHWANRRPSREAIVPGTDRDCDEVAAPECAPYTPNATGTAATIAQASCLVPVAIGLETLCVLGGPPCNEVTPQASCARLDRDYCTVAELCDCAIATDPDCVAERINIGGAQGNMPLVYCSFPFQQDGSACPPGTAKTQLDLGAFLAAPDAASCTAVRIGDAKPPFGPFASNVTLSGGAVRLSAFSACKVDIEWTGDSTNVSKTPLLLEVDLDNDKHLVLPLLVEPSRVDCTRPANCSVNPDHSGHSIYMCAGRTTGCEPDPGAGCASGPSCGGACCGAGERCENGTCMCGAGPACPSGELCTTGGPSSGGPECGWACCGGPGWPCPL